VLRQARVRAGQEHRVVGEHPLAGPHLLAVDDVVTVLARGAGRQARQVGARVRLRVELAPDLLGGQDLRDIAPLLRLRAVGDQGRPDDPDAQAVDRRRRLGARRLLGEDRLLHRPRVVAAVLAGPVQPNEAGPRACRAGSARTRPARAPGTPRPRRCSAGPLPGPPRSPARPAQRFSRTPIYQV
jgi:hypothetical protein